MRDAPRLKPLEENFKRVGAIPANIVQADGSVYETFDVNNNSATHVFDAVLHEDELLLAVSTDTNDPGSTTDAALISLRPKLDGSPSRLAAVLGTDPPFPRGDNRFTGLRVLSDGDVLAVGTTDSFTPSVRDTNVWAARLTYDENDSMTPWNSVWQRLYMGSDDDRARSLVATTDGYAIIAATMSYGAGGSHAWVLEIDPEGSVQDQYALGAPAVATATARTCYRNHSRQCMRPAGFEPASHGLQSRIWGKTW